MLPWPLMIFLIPVSFYSSLPLPSQTTLTHAFKLPNATIFNWLNLSKSIKKIILIQLCNFQIPKKHNLKLNAAHQNQYAIMNLNIFQIQVAIYLILCNMNVKTFQNLISHIWKKINLKIWNCLQIIYKILYLISSISSKINFNRFNFILKNALVLIQILTKSIQKMVQNNSIKNASICTKNQFSFSSNLTLQK